MNALSRLQAAVIFQAAEDESIASKLTSRAKTMIVFGVLVAAGLASQDAHAQQGPLTPSNCAGVGMTVGGAAGAATGKTNTQHIIGAALGALGGAAAGNWLCSPKSTRSQDSSYANAANYGYGNGGGNPSYAVERQSPRAPLSFSEREHLDGLSKGAIDAKYEWKKSLYMIDQARAQNNQMAFNSARETESQARQSFEQRRAAFATTVAKLNNGAEGIEPRAVGRYIEISAALLELNTESRMSYQMLEARDNEMKSRSQAYVAEANRVGSLRNNNGY